MRLLKTRRSLMVFGVEGVDVVVVALVDIDLVEVAEHRRTLGARRRRRTALRRRRSAGERNRAGGRAGDQRAARDLLLIFVCMDVLPLFF